ncbi:hypothetical protein Taro_002749, partial [Colocasia esculenta]|nr:hypothetical protein [Colocasia esculenta]
MPDTSRDPGLGSLDQSAATSTAAYTKSTVRDLAVNILAEELGDKRS